MDSAGEELAEAARGFREASGRFEGSLSRSDAEALLEAVERYVRLRPAAALRARAAEEGERARARLACDDDRAYASEEALRDAIEAMRSEPGARARRRALARIERRARLAPEPAVREAYRIALERCGFDAVADEREPVPTAARAAYAAAEVRVTHSPEAVRSLLRDPEIRAASRRIDLELAARHEAPGYARSHAESSRRLIQLTRGADRAFVVREVSFGARHSLDRRVACALAVLLADLASSDAFKEARRRHERAARALEERGEFEAADRARRAFEDEWPEEAERARAELAEALEEAFARRRDRPTARRLLGCAWPWQPAHRAARERLEAPDDEAYAARLAEGYRRRIFAAPGADADAARREARRIRDGAEDGAVRDAMRGLLEEACARDRAAYLDAAAALRDAVELGGSRAAAHATLDLYRAFVARWPEDDDARDAVLPALDRDEVDDDEAAARVAARLGRSEGAEAVALARRALALATDAPVRAAIEALLDGLYRAERGALDEAARLFAEGRSRAGARRLVDLARGVAERWPDRHRPDDAGGGVVLAEAASRLEAPGGEEGYAVATVRALRGRGASEASVLALARGELEQEGPTARALRALARELALEAHDAGLVLPADATRADARLLLERHRAFAAGRAGEWGGEEPPIGRRARRALREAALRADVDDEAWERSRREGGGRPTPESVLARCALERSALEAELERLHVRIRRGVSRAAAEEAVARHAAFFERWGPAASPDRGEGGRAGAILAHARQRLAIRATDAEFGAWFLGRLREVAAAGPGDRRRMEELARRFVEYATEEPFRAAGAAFLREGRRPRSRRR